ncbi:hypothetical protein AYO38_09935 [bacterium SCGC AG-212-C10]|nr:hypothetical protein AYO38_09935 [bacterium SCGC AG-212-C10]
MSERIVLALGSNLGDRAGNLRAAVALLADRGVHVLSTSSVWETAPVPAGQPAFFNAVIAGETVHSPESLLATAKEVERILGRRPNRVWGPRPADVDILFYGESRIETALLQIPHARIAERAFVLVPLSEVVRGDLPIFGASALTLLARTDSSGIWRTGSTLEPRPRSPSSAR